MIREKIYKYLSSRGYIKRVVTGKDTHLIINGVDKGMCNLRVYSDVEYKNTGTANVGTFSRVVENVIIKIDYEGEQ